MGNPRVMPCFKYRIHVRADVINIFMVARLVPLTADQCLGKRVWSSPTRGPNNTTHMHYNTRRLPARSVLSRFILPYAELLMAFPIRRLRRRLKAIQHRAHPLYSRSSFCGCSILGLLAGWPIYFLFVFSSFLFQNIPAL